MQKLLIPLIVMPAMLLFSLPEKTMAAENDTIVVENQKVKPSRLTIEGSGEVVFTRNFYSDNELRYSHPDRYKDAKGHGRVDLPQIAIELGYDFGRGWTMCSEVEFEHGGNGVALGLNEETGELENEIENGGEIAFEQFWIQKSFSDAFNIRLGHVVVPVGQTNGTYFSDKFPTQFFTAYRPEGEFTIMPCTWHETGVSVWGEIGKWRYEAVVVPALDSKLFTAANWVKDGIASGYGFRVANNLAGAARIDNYSVKNLHLALSGYVGNTFNNDIVTDETDEYKNVKGTLMIGAFEFDYKANGLVVKGNLDYGHLNDAAAISAYNGNRNRKSLSSSPCSLVGENAVAIGGEMAYDIFHCMKSTGDRKFYVFGRYDYYDSYIPYASAVATCDWTERHVMTLGVNYYPIEQIVIKAEFSERFLKKQYNSEPMFSLGVAYSGSLLK